MSRSPRRPAAARRLRHERFEARRVLSATALEAPAATFAELFGEHVQAGVAAPSGVADSAADRRPAASKGAGWTAIHDGTDLTVVVKGAAYTAEADAVRFTGFEFTASFDKVTPADEGPAWLVDAVARLQASGNGGRDSAFGGWDFEIEVGDAAGYDLDAGRGEMSQDPDGSFNLSTLEAFETGAPEARGGAVAVDPEQESQLGEPPSAAATLDAGRDDYDADDRLGSEPEPPAGLLSALRAEPAMRRVEFADAPPAGVDAPGAGAVDLTALLLEPAKPSSPRLESIAAVEPPVETRARDAAFAVESWVRTQPIQFAGATVDDAAATAGRETAQRPGSDAPRTGAVGLGARSVTPESPAPTRRDADPPADRSAQNAAPRPASSYLYTALTSLLGGSLVWTWGRRRAESGCVERPPRSRWRPVLRD